MNKEYLINNKMLNGQAVLTAVGLRINGTLSITFYRRLHL